MDPEHQNTDEELWTALEAVHLKDTFRSTGLDGDLFTGGCCGLSVGQQQLLSLARAALRPSPFLVLDEPSSALDAEAEQTLHHCLDHLFHDRTILLIAVCCLEHLIICWNSNLLLSVVAPSLELAQVRLDLRLGRWTNDITGTS